MLKSKNNRLPLLWAIRTDRAFTLLEVMVAVAIIAIALVTLFGSQSRSLSYASEAQFNIVAPMLASLKLAEVERGVVEGSAGEGDFGEDFVGYNWKMETKDAELDLQTPLKLKKPLQKISLTVLRNGSPFTYTLTSYGQMVKR